MKIHDELHERMRHSAAAVPTGDPPVEAIVRRARHRKVRRRAGIAILAVVLAAGVTLPLWALGGLGSPRDHVTGIADGGATPTATPLAFDVTQNVLAQATCKIPGGFFATFQLSSSEPDPTQGCQHLWQTGDLSKAFTFSSQTGSTDLPEHKTVPPLVPCAGLGKVAVIAVDEPTNDTCAERGLAPMPQGWRQTLARWDNVMDLIHKEFPGVAGSCVTHADAIAFFRSALSDEGFTDWKVLDEWHDRADRPCAAFAFEYDKEAIAVVSDTIS